MSRKEPKHSWLLAAAVLLCSCMILGASELVPRLRYGYPFLHRPVQQVRKIDDAGLMIVVLRKQERSSEKDSQTPFRGSDLCIYTLGVEEWKQVSRIFRCRSQTTNLNEPNHAELRLGSSGISSVKFGYVSVPIGLYKAVECKWKDGKNRAFQLSDWNDESSIIRLKEPEILQTLELSLSDDNTMLVKNSNSIEKVVAKGETYLHPTITREWSYADSFGCINLASYSEGSSSSDWEEFLKVLDANRRIVHGAVPFIPFLIIDKESSDLDVLPPVFPRGLIDKFRVRI